MESSLRCRLWNDWEFRWLHYILVGRGELSIFWMSRIPQRFAHCNSQRAVWCSHSSLKLAQSKTSLSSSCLSIGCLDKNSSLNRSISSTMSLEHQTPVPASSASPSTSATIILKPAPSHWINTTTIPIRRTMMNPPRKKASRINGTKTFVRFAQRSTIRSSKT